MRFFVFLFAFLLLGGFVDLETVAAQQSAGVAIQPSLIERGADPGETFTEPLGISNLNDQEQTFYLFVRDIRGVRPNGSPIFDEGELEKTGFEISEWVQLGQTEITIPANGSVTVPITVNVPADATPGSHFGGVFVSVEPPRLRSVGASVGYEVANILSIRIAGDAQESAMIRSFSTDNLVYGSTDVEFTAQVRNTGNVLVRPIGPLEVTNMFGSNVATFQFNENQNGVFPGTSRTFNANWTDDSIGFGRYEARLSLVYGEVGRLSTISSTVVFWILPMNIIGPALAILAVILLVTYIGIKLYVRRKIAMLAGGNVRRLNRRRQQTQSTSTLMLILIVMLSVTALFLLILLILFA